VCQTQLESVRFLIDVLSSSVSSVCRCSVRVSPRCGHGSGVVMGPPESDGADRRPPSRWFLFSLEESGAVAHKQTLSTPNPTSKNLTHIDNVLPLDYDSVEMQIRETITDKIHYTALDTGNRTFCIAYVVGDLKTIRRNALAMFSEWLKLTPESIQLIEDQNQVWTSI
jgi:hypothetical protein